MNYQRVYDDFIVSRREREDELEVFDRHHVVPRCLGGSNDAENIIRLRPSDHLFAHVLLAKIHGGVLVMSAIRMSGMKRYNGGRASRSRYQHLREQHRKLAREFLLSRRDEVSAAMKGNRHCVGRVQSSVTKERKQRAWTPEMRERQRQRMLGNSYGLNQTPEARARLSAGQQRRYARERSE